MTGFLFCHHWSIGAGMSSTLLLSSNLSWKPWSWLLKYWINFWLILCPDICSFPVKPFQSLGTMSSLYFAPEQRYWIFIYYSILINSLGPWNIDSSLCGLNISFRLLNLYWPWTCLSSTIFCTIILSLFSVSFSSPILNMFNLQHRHNLV